MLVWERPEPPDRPVLAPLSRERIVRAAIELADADGLAAVWEVAAPLLNSPPAPVSYPQGSWGPAEATPLIAPDHWLLGQ